MITINKKVKDLFNQLFLKMDLNGYTGSLDLLKIEKTFNLKEVDDMIAIEDANGNIKRLTFENLRVEYKGWRTNEVRLQAPVLWWYLEHIYLSQHYEVFKYGVLIDIVYDKNELDQYDDKYIIEQWYENKKVA